MTATQHDRESGSALAVSIIFVLALMGMSAAVVSTSFYRQSAARATHENERAYERALAGLDIAMFEMREGIDLAADGIGAASGATGGGSWAVTITPTFAGPGDYTLAVTGSFGPAAQGLEVVIGIDDGLEFGLFGRDGISMSGSFSTDSYDSSAGTYASQVSGGFAGDGGDLGSNGGINAGGGTVHGDATPGPGFTVSSPSNVTGATAPATSPVAVPPYVYSPAIASSGSYSGPGTLAAGVYRYDQFTLSGSSVLTIDGDVTLWVDGKFDASGGSTIDLLPGASLTIHHGTNDFKVSGGGIINQDRAPERLQLFSASTTKVELSGGSDFHGVVTAPEAEFISSGGSHLYGAISARSATLSGDGWLHFDTALTGAGGGTGNFVIRSARKVRAL